MGRLSDSASLYLRQHADDPVDWRAWGDEAFAEAAACDRPVFLSIGYSSCHWCHVMQRESFRAPAVATLLNERFVPVKVDREQRPDVDAVYMDYVSATTGGGGWPMSVFLTHERLPVFGGTYFPPEHMPQMPSFTEVLEGIDAEYRAERTRIRDTAASAHVFLEEMTSPPPAGEMDVSLVVDAARAVWLSADSVDGGFGRTPKFPRFSSLLFLAEVARHGSDVEVTETLAHALHAMLRGGIWDQAGGGLCRYAVDAAWTVPHFEKMLVDNALLLRALAAARPIVPSAEWEHAARETVTWLEREMLLPSGAYASALSADTDGVEGGTYVWTREQLAAALNAKELALAEAALGIDGEPQLDGAYVLTRRGGRAADATEVDSVLAKLSGARSARPQPERDDKAVVSWNAIAARGLIEAGRVFGDDSMAARGVALTRMLVERCSPAVVHVLDDPSVAGLRLAEDHAHLVAALLSAHETTGDAVLLAEAERIQGASVAQFVEDDTVWMTPAQTDLPIRPRERQDEPMPSGASVLAENAVRLAEITGEPAHADLAARLLARHAAIAAAAPQSAGAALAAMARLLGS